LSPGNRRGTFPGGSLGWRVSQENFFKNSSVAKVWTDFKLRGSYAQVGNVDIGNYPYAGTYLPYLYGAQAAIGYSQFGNALLRYETSKKEDYGIDLGFFDGRITVSADYYRNLVDGLILGVQTPPSDGVPLNQYNANVGTLYNKGFELVVTTQNINRQDFSWSTSLNFSTNVNKVTALDANNTPLYPTYLGGSYTVTKVGESISSLYGYDYQGVNPANGNPLYKKIDGTIVQGDINT
ncbi:TonB-dependent receptor, partial [Salmonella enterica]|nr:TonB-dependent receptor [Salmonella enterica]